MGHGYVPNLHCYDCAFESPVVNFPWPSNCTSEPIAVKCAVFVSYCTTHTKCVFVQLFGGFFVWKFFKQLLNPPLFGNFPDNHPDWCTKLTLGVFLCICISVFIFVFLLLHKRVDCSKRFLLPIAPRAPIAAEPSLAVDPIDLHGFWF